MPNQPSSRFRRSSTRLLTAAAACATLTGACAQDSATRQASDLHPIAAQLGGQDLSASADDLGLNAQVPDDGVQLVGRSFRGHLYSTAGKKPKMARAGALTEQDLLPPEDGDQGIVLDPAEGPLRSAGYFTGFRMHTEWFLKLLERLDAIPAGSGTLLDQTAAVYTSEIQNGSHRHNELPFVIAGGGALGLAQGKYFNSNGAELKKVWCTIGAAVGLKNGDGSRLSNFGNSSQAGGQLNEMVD